MLSKVDALRDLLDELTSILEREQTGAKETEA
jgi:hypothetical protein